MLRKKVEKRAIWTHKTMLLTHQYLNTQLEYDPPDKVIFIYKRSPGT